MTCSDFCCVYADLNPSDLLIAAALVDVHGAAHLRPVADRLSAAAAQMTPTTEESSDGD